MSMNCPFRAILKFSPMKVEKVVNPPHNPVVRSNLSSGERLPVRSKSPVRSPRTKHPRTFTVNVPSGRLAKSTPAVRRETK